MRVKNVTFLNFKIKLKAEAPCQTSDFSSFHLLILAPAFPKFPHFSRVLATTVYLSIVTLKVRILFSFSGEWEQQTGQKHCNSEKFVFFVFF